jgi:type II secretory pathway component PulF
MLSEFGVQPPKSIILIQNVREYIQDNFITFTAIFLGFAYIIISQIREIPLFSSAKLSICTRALAICLDNGIALQKALILTSYLISGKIKKEMELEVGRILRGLTPSFSFIKEFQEELLSSFERGRLSQVLLSVSDIYLDRAKREAEIIKRAIEPALFIITSIFLIFFIVSIYLPIIEKIREMM